MYEWKPNDIIVVGKEGDGELLFYFNHKVDKLKASKLEMQELADRKRADISWLIEPDDDPPIKNIPF